MFSSLSFLFYAIFLVVVDIDTMLRTSGEAATVEVVIILGAVAVDGLYHGMAGARRLVVAAKTRHQSSCSRSSACTEIGTERWYEGLRLILRHFMPVAVTL